MVARFTINKLQKGGDDMEIDAEIPGMNEILDILDENELENFISMQEEAGIIFNTLIAESPELAIGREIIHQGRLEGNFSFVATNEADQILVFLFSNSRPLEEVLEALEDMDSEHILVYNLDNVTFYFSGKKDDTGNDRLKLSFFINESIEIFYDSAAPEGREIVMSELNAGTSVLETLNMHFKDSTDENELNDLDGMEEEVGENMLFENTNSCPRGKPIVGGKNKNKRVTKKKNGGKRKKYVKSKQKKSRRKTKP